MNPTDRPHDTPRRSKRLLLVSLVLSGTGLACLALFRAIGSTVDSDGVLHEPFGLIPIGWLCLLLGLVFGGLYVIKAVRGRIPRGPS